MHYINNEGIPFKVQDKTYKQVKKKHKGFFKLITDTESLNNDEKQYHLDILPSMSDDHIEKIYEVIYMESEEIKMAIITCKLEMELSRSKHKKRMNELNQDHLVNWKEK